jgi:hypothetical protein
MGPAPAIMPLLFGTAATGTAAATAGLIGTGGALSLGGAMSLGSLAMTGASMLSSRSAAGDVKDEARRKAEMEAATTSEKLKRLEEENRRKESLARARAAASGVGGASTEIYIGALEKAGREEMDWLKEVGASSYQSALAEGRNAYTDAMTGFWGSAGKAAGAIGNMWSTYDPKKSPLPGSYSGPLTIS